MSTLLEQWRETAYSREMTKQQLESFWGAYFQTEKGIYEKLLSNPDEKVKGTVKELAEKYGVEVLTESTRALSMRIRLRRWRRIPKSL